MTGPGPMLVTFRLDRTDYAVPVSAVVELTPERDVAPVPGTSQVLSGVTAWRGRTIPVVDQLKVIKR